MHPSTERPQGLPPSRSRLKKIQAGWAVMEPPAQDLVMSVSSSTATNVIKRLTMKSRWESMHLKFMRIRKLTLATYARKHLFTKPHSKCTWRNTVGFTHIPVPIVVRASLHEVTWLDTLLLSTLDRCYSTAHSATWDSTIRATLKCMLKKCIQDKHQPYSFHCRNSVPWNTWPVGGMVLWTLAHFGDLGIPLIIAAIHNHISLCPNPYSAIGLQQCNYIRQNNQVPKMSPYSQLHTTLLSIAGTLTVSTVILILTTDNCSVLD